MKFSPGSCAFLLKIGKSPDEVVDMINAHTKKIDQIEDLSINCFENGMSCLITDAEWGDQRVAGQVRISNMFQMPLMQTYNHKVTV